MKSRVLIIPLLCFVVFSSASQLSAQKRYNIKSFSIYVPAGWKLDDHDVNKLVISSTEVAFYLSFMIIDEGDEEIKWNAILGSLGESFNFDEELTDEGGINLDNGLHVTYKFCIAKMTEDNSKWKFIWSQVDNDKDYTILIYGFCDAAKFGWYQSHLWNIYENIDYKKE